MATKHDYYGYLGVNRAASADDIPKAYRKQAQRYQPEAAGNDPHAAAKLKLIQEAYDVLSDARKREEYDRAWFADIDSAFTPDIPAAPTPKPAAAWQGLGDTADASNRPAASPARFSLGIELTTGQKVQVGFILVALAIAGVFVFKSTRPAFDSSINSYPQLRRHAANDLRITTTNPADPKKEEHILVFAAASEGRMYLIEFPNNPDAHLKIQWEPETRLPGIVFHYFQDPFAPLATIKDAFRHGLAYATYNAVDWGAEFPNLKAKALGLLGSTNMTPEQAAKEAEARKLMTSEISFINISVEQGTYETKLMDQLKKALDAYKAMKGDPLKDAAKAELARKVMEAAAAFERQELKDKYVSIDRYINTMDGLLELTQKNNLIAAVAADIAKKSGKPVVPGTRRGPAPGAGIGGGTGTGAGGARGGAAGGAGGARGAATRGGARGATAPAGG